VFTPYAPRRLTSLGPRTENGVRLKTYSITFDDEPFDPARFAGGWRLAAGEILPQDFTLGRPGAGFAVLHQGRTGDYFVLGWWDRENELPLKVFVRDASDWRPARGGESVCVWDLAVVWHEREAYVNTVLAGKPVEEYIRFTLDGWV
jgi:hypothetical protein